MYKKRNIVPTSMSSILHPSQHIFLDYIRLYLETSIGDLTFSETQTCKKAIYILHFLHTHRWFNMTNIIPHNPDDGSLEPKRYSVNFASQKISPSTLITLLSFFLHKLSG